MKLFRTRDDTTAEDETADDNKDTAMSQEPSQPANDEQSAATTPPSARVSKDSGSLYTPGCIQRSAIMP